MEKQWYYADGEKTEGPVSESSLMQMISCSEISKDTLVWTEGMTDWTSASNIGKFDNKSKLSAHYDIPTTHESTEHEIVKQNYLPVILIVSAVVLFLGGLIYYSQGREPSSSDKAVQSQSSLTNKSPDNSADANLAPANTEEIDEQIEFERASTGDRRIQEMLREAIMKDTDFIPISIHIIKAGNPYWERPGDPITQVMQDYFAEGLNQSKIKFYQLMRPILVKMQGRCKDENIGKLKAYEFECTILQNKWNEWDLYGCDVPEGLCRK